jgi:hypothetical protein
MNFHCATRLRLPLRPIPVNAKVTEPGSKDGIPAEMCRRCGAPDEQHEDASECISFWRDRTAKLEFRLPAAQGRKAIPRSVAG